MNPAEVTPAENIIYEVQTKGAETGWSTIYNGRDKNVAMTKAAGETASVRVHAFDTATYKMTVIFKRAAIRKGGAK